MSFFVPLARAADLERHRTDQVRAGPRAKTGSPDAYPRSPSSSKLYELVTDALLGFTGKSESAASQVQRGAAGRWWSWRELNPRPQAFNEQFYMLSDLFWISPNGSRSRTLPEQPVPLSLASGQGTRPEASQCEVPLQLEACAFCPAHRPTVARLDAIKRRGRTKNRSQLVCFSWIYEVI